MKIAFVGKGGSGKTTLSSLLCRYMAQSDFPILAIDADINQHMAQALEMEKEAANIPSMGIEINRIKEYLRGSNPLIVDTTSMIKTTPPGRGSRFIRLSEDNPIFDYFSRESSRVKLMAVGSFSEDDLGVKCYHSKTGAVELLLNHIIDKEKEYVVVDMTAGADSFASGLFTRFDITFLVVEPTIKSVNVYEQYKKHAKNYGVRIKVIGNKIENKEDIEFIKKYVGDDLVATVSSSQFFKRKDRGEYVVLDELEEGNTYALAQIISVIDSQKKDWQKFYRQAVEFHSKNAKSWANVALGQDLQKQIDPHFTIDAVCN